MIPLSIGVLILCQVNVEENNTHSSYRLFPQSANCATARFKGKLSVSTSGLYPGIDHESAASALTGSISGVDKQLYNFFGNTSINFI